MRVRRGGLRMGFVVIVVFAVVVAFVVRLVDIQVVSASALAEQAKEKRAIATTIYGTRGNIVDRNGAVLADSVERYTITVSPRVAFRNQELYGPVLPWLEQIAGVTGQDPSVLLTIMEADRDADYAVLAENLSLDQLLAINELDIPWVWPERVEARTYPNGAVAGNLIGFLGKDEPLAGLERSENECLDGKDGTVTFERSVDGVRIPNTEIVEEPAEDGGTLQLTIDRDLQWYVQEAIAKTGQRLGATWAAAVVIRISDGALMAVADWPTVDPNAFEQADPAVTGSRAFAIPYEPGSIMKPINAAIVIDQGAATPTTPVDAPYMKSFGDGGLITDSSWHDPHLTLTGSLVHSSNVATSMFADMVPDDVRREYLLDFGFNDWTEVDFFGESAGLVHPLENWDARTRLVQSYGQAITTTILQMASAYQTLGNNGVRMPLKLVESCTMPDGTVITPDRGEPRQVVSESSADQVLAMMEMVYQHNGLWDQLEIPGYRVGVKSGTAEVAENGVYTQKVDISYAGVAPIDNPQYAVVVSAGIPYALLSGAIASTFRDVMSQTLTMFRVPPSQGEAVQLPITW